MVRRLEVMGYPSEKFITNLTMATAVLLPVAIVLKMPEELCHDRGVSLPFHETVARHHCAKLLAFKRIREPFGIVHRHDDASVRNVVETVRSIMIPTAQIGPASKQCLPVRRGVILGQGFHLKVNRGSEKTGLDVRPHAGLQAADVGTKNTHGKQRAAMLVDDRRAHD